MTSVAKLVTVFLCLHLLAKDEYASRAEAGYLAFDGRGEVLWGVATALGYATPAEVPAFRTPRGDGESFVLAHRGVLNALRGRIHPVAPPRK